MLKFMSFASHAFSNLFHKPVTTQYPFKPKQYKERTRGHIEIKIEDCLFCGICAKKCPSDAITVDRAEKTWSIERMGCVQCSNCVNACPKKCLSMENAYSEPQGEKTLDTFNGPKAPENEAPKGGEVTFNSENCVYCTLCAKKCPQGAITVDRAEKNWSIDKSVCVGCGICVSSCPKKCITM